MPQVMVLAPMAGWASALDEVPDEVFSGRILGDGLAIDPTSSRLLSPCDGVIVALASHAVTVRASNGAEILVHVGLETVALKGEGFSPLARQGQSVKAGDPILEFDLNLLAAKAKSLVSPVVIANGENFTITSRVQNRLVAAGDVLMEIAPLADSVAPAPMAQQTISQSVRVASEHGLHARPAAMLANAAKRFPGEVTLGCRGRSVSAKSAVAIMALGVRFGDEVTISGSHEAVEALTALLRSEPQKAAEVLKPVAAASALPENTATIIHGVPAAPGRALGRVVRLRNRDIEIPETGRGMPQETAAFREALAGLRARLERVAASGDRTRREILSAHLSLLDDAELHRTTHAMIEQGKSAGFAWRQALRAYGDAFRAMDDARMRERAGDMLDLERQLLVLLSGDAKSAAPLPPSSILIAEEILPSDLAGEDAAHIAGIASAGGGPTSHVAILAAGMNIPALVGAGPALLSVADGSDVLLDADNGVLDLRPDPQTVASARQAVIRAAERQVKERAQACTDCFTADGARVEVFANLGKGAAEAAEAVRLGAEGCGVLRTEFLFMDRATPPDEEEQYIAYRAIADSLDGRSFILRTFDIGADKPVPYLTFPPEDNPQLGLRGLRAGFVWPDLLTVQLKAAARVGCKIMLPMINTAAEVAAVRDMLGEICRAANLPLPPLGAMIETPSSAMLADQLAAEADFLSIGTNDLTQYVLAIDRGHRQLSSQLDALHPAVLRLIARTALAANAAGKTAAVCGGLAADLNAAPLLVGLGIGELSVPPPVIPRLKAVIRGLDRDECRAAAEQALSLTSAAAVRAFVKTRFAREDHP